MKKLKLESLEVTSFETGSAGPQERGTVNGRAKPEPDTFRNCPETAFHCPTDPNFDCTYGCSYFTGCLENCGLTQDVDCVLV
jgi:hypothetical protein